MKKYLLTILIFTLAITACTAGNGSASLIGSWNLTSFGPAASPTPAVADSGASLTFNQDGTITGNSGCNGFGGNYKIDDDKVTFSEVVSTLMACDEAHMQQEGVVHQVLTDTATYKLEGNTLTLNNNDVVLVFTKLSYP